MAKKKLTFAYVTEQAESDRGMSNKNAVYFHYFNPNGLYAAKKKLDDEIRALVDSGAVKSGWHLAYGSFNDFHSESIRKLVQGRRRPGNIETSVAIEGLRREVEKIAAKIQEVKVGA